MRRSLAAAVAAMALSLLPARAAEAPTVAIDTGRIAGSSDGAVDVYKGIPYAAPPVGALRWMPPAPAAAWPGTRDATAFGAICPQPQRPDRLAGGTDQPQSENCLFLNVFAPHAARGAPVMVWIHGGAHRFGSGSAPIYDGTHFARDGVILVSINYRLGLLGFFAHPALTKAAAPDAPLGNYGLMDQVAALRWVKRNIAAFGGDPDNVTVFGESAGAADTLYLLATPAAKGLFARAIVESGGGWYGRDDLGEKEGEGAEFATKAGLPGATATPDQLRAIPAAQTLDLPARLGFGPFVDGRWIPRSPTAAFADGSAMDVPLIIGSNDFEASLMTAFKIPAQTYLSRLTPAARAAYADDAKNDDTLAHALFTDAIMGAPAHWIAAKAAAGAPSYLYHFSYVAERMRAFLPGAAHGTEIPYVFDNGEAVAARFGIALGADDVKMEQWMHGCWVAFAKTGTPCVGWPAFDPATDALMEFGYRPGVVRDFRKAQYQAIEDALRPN